MLKTGIGRKNNVQSHSLRSQNRHFPNVFQSKTPDFSSLASLGVGLGVRVIARVCSAVLELYGDAAVELELKLPEFGGYGYPEGS